MRRLALLLPLLVACTPAARSPDEAPAPAPPPAAAPAAAPADGVLGDHTVTITESDVPATAPADLRTGVAGTWAIAFHPGNHYVVTFNGQPAVEGTYRVEGDRLIIDPNDSGPRACGSGATYTFQTGSGGQVTFTRVEDDCLGRRIVLATRPLTRVQ